MQLILCNLIQPPRQNWTENCAYRRQINMQSLLLLVVNCNCNWLTHCNLCISNKVNYLGKLKKLWNFVNNFQNKLHFLGWLKYLSKLCVQMYSTPACLEVSSNFNFTLATSPHTSIVYCLCTPKVEATRGSALKCHALNRQLTTFHASFDTEAKRGSNAMREKYRTAGTMPSVNGGQV